MRPKTLGGKNAAVQVTMDEARRELHDAGLYIEDNHIVAVGPAETLPATADEIINLRGHIVLPGLINTHHYMYQSLNLPMSKDRGFWQAN